MKLAIVSDIHANLQAWEVVEADVLKAGVDAVICLGDVVGYGPRPVEVLQSVRSFTPNIILGNHDAIPGGQMKADVFNDRAREIIEWTCEQLDEEAHSYLSELPYTIELTKEKYLFTHADVVDPAQWGYITNPAEARANFAATKARVIFFGHSHFPGVFVQDKKGEITDLPGNALQFEKGKRYLINPGSVGDPRTADVRASYCLLDTELGALTFRQIPFDTEGFRSDLETAGISSKPWFLSCIDGEAGHPSPDHAIANPTLIRKSPGAGTAAPVLLKTTSAPVATSAGVPEELEKSHRVRNLLLGLVGLIALSLLGLMGWQRFTGRETLGEGLASAPNSTMPEASGSLPVSPDPDPSPTLDSAGGTPAPDPEAVPDPGPKISAEAEELRTRLAKAEAERKALLDPIRTRLQTEIDTRLAADFIAPKPTAFWDFEGSADDSLSGLKGRLEGTAKIEGGALVLDGEGMLFTEPIGSDIRAKTLEVLVELENLDQRGGGAMTIQDAGGKTYDSIVFAQNQPRKWMAGSEKLRRTDNIIGNRPETATGGTPVHLIIAYEENGTIRGYRNGAPLGKSYRKGATQTFEKGSAHLAFGLRHGKAATDPERMLKGRILEARLYDRALTPQEIAGLSGRVLGPGLPKVTSIPEKADGLKVPVIKLDPARSSIVDRKIDLVGPYTIEAWLKFDEGVGADDSLLGSGASAGSGAGDFNFHKGQLRLYAGKRHWDRVVAKREIEPNLWTHVAVTRDQAGKLQIYLDGKFDSEGGQPWTVDFKGLRIGASYRAGTYSGFELREFRHWNYARSAEQILTDLHTDYGDAQTEGLLHRISGDTEGLEFEGAARIELVKDFPKLTTVGQPRAAQPIAGPRSSLPAPTVTHADILKELGKDEKARLATLDKTIATAQTEIAKLAKEAAKPAVVAAADPPPPAPKPAEPKPAPKPKPAPAPVPKPAPEPEPDPDPTVAWWRLEDDATKSLADLRGAHPLATLSPGTEIAGIAPKEIPATGDANAHARQIGIWAQAKADDTFALRPDRSFTFEGWLLSDRLRRPVFVAGTRTGEEDRRGWHLDLRPPSRTSPSGGMSFFYDSGDKVVQAHAEEITATDLKPHHFAVVWKHDAGSAAGEMRLFFDGVQVAAAPLPHKEIAANALPPFRVGSPANPGRVALDELRFSSIALQPHEFLLKAPVTGVTMTKASGSARDSWANPANWEGGDLPSGDDNALLADGVHAQLENAAVGSYNGDLVLGAGSKLVLWTDQARNALPYPPATIRFNTGSQLILRGPIQDFGPMELLGDAIFWGGQSTSGHGQVRRLKGPITGTGQLTLEGVNRGTFELTAANPFSGGTIAKGSQNQPYRLIARANGVFGSGDVTVFPPCIFEITPGLTDAIDDKATLNLHEGVKLILNSEETVAKLVLAGEELGEGSYSNKSHPGMIEGDGEIIVVKPR